MLPRLVVFDMAGTTVQDNGEVPTAFGVALARHAIGVSRDQLVAVRGSSKRQAVFDLVPEGPLRAEIADAAYASFRAELARTYERGGARPADGAVEIIEALRSRGTRVALTTGFDRDIAALLLSTLGWDSGTVDAIVCGDEVRNGRPAPDLIFRAMDLTGIGDADDVANVGDTTVDLQAGRNAGVRWNIGVTSGAHGRERLERAPHTHLISSLPELARIWALHA
jgi:phosphonatase-like hydrolase